MNIEDLNDNIKEFKVLNKPIPYNFTELPYLSKVRYAPLIYSKRKILRGRANTPLEVLKNEICVFTPGLHMEYLRCTDLDKMNTYLDHLQNPILEVNLTGVAPVIGIRVGENMSQLLNSRSVTLKINDIYGEELTIPIIETTFIRNKTI